VAAAPTDTGGARVPAWKLTAATSARSTASPGSGVNPTTTTTTVAAPTTTMAPPTTTTPAAEVDRVVAPPTTTALPTTTTTTTAPATLGAVHYGQVTYYAHPAGGCASPWLPFGTVVRITNPANGASVECVVNDREADTERSIDLATATFAEIAPLSQGVINAELSW
jgi:rare lipoprotein A (peptidoglycan hydrolase)